MNVWPSSVIGLRFTPREVAKITGVDEVRQRLIAKRHFDPIGDIAQRSGAHRRWSWRAMQMLAVFEDLMADLGKADVALRMVAAAEVAQGFDLDLRSHPDGDVLIVVHFQHPVLTEPRLTSVAALANDQPSRFYACNLSALQRRMAAAAEM